MNSLFDSIWAAYSGRVKSEIEWLETERIWMTSRIEAINDRLKMLAQEKQEYINFVLSSQKKRDLL